MKTALFGLSVSTQVLQGYLATHSGLPYDAEVQDLMFVKINAEDLITFKFHLIVACQLCAVK